MASLLLSIFGAIGPGLLSRFLGGGLVDRLVGVADRWIASASDRRRVELEEFKAMLQAARDLQAERAAKFNPNARRWFWFQAAFIVPLLSWYWAVMFDTIVGWFLLKGTSWEDWYVDKLPPPIDEWAFWMMVFLFGYGFYKWREARGGR